MTAVGDRVSVVMGSDGKYYAKSSGSVAVGDTVQVFIGSDGKYYASKSGNPSAGGRVLVSMDSTGKYIAHISKTTIIPPDYDLKIYQGWGGGDESIYTVWAYRYGGVWDQCIEKRDASSLEITQIDTNISLDALENTLNYNYVGGTSRYFIRRKVSTSYTFQFLDSTDSYNVAFETTLSPSPPSTTSAGISGDVVTYKTGSILGYIFYKYDLNDGSLIGTYNVGSSGAGNQFASGGSSSVFYNVSGSKQMAKRDFPAGTNYITGDIAANTLFMGNNNGYESLLPTDIGSDLCTGYKWNSNTLTRTAL